MGPRPYVGANVSNDVNMPFLFSPTGWWLVAANGLDTTALGTMEAAVGSCPAPLTLPELFQGTWEQLSLALLVTLSGRFSQLCQRRICHLPLGFRFDPPNAVLRRL